ncbi:Voltage-dependent T-type calcium channel subunit alpha-1H [Eufriesea mexicana]|nr:Voltage-dependent T-type calcium channel subunit alpha-1H [Eufriesea mexicana]
MGNGVVQMEGKMACGINEEEGTKTLDGEQHRILGMYLFGGKFCMWADRSRPCTCAEVVSRHPMCRCDRKHFNDIVWALVTVFQILTQEDWNVVLFNGMQKTSHWAALYFVALMTFGNYVLFNLLVAILVEGFSSERNERREREQREMARLAAKEGGMGSDDGSSRISRSHSITDSDTYTQLTYNELEALLRQAINETTPYDWKGFCKHVETLEHEYWTKDGIIEDATEDLELEIQSSESDKESDDNSSEDL